MTLTLFHTAAVHETMFNTLRDRVAPGQDIVHVTRPDWLARAQSGMDDALRDDITAAIAEAGTALCTCTTIGEVAEAAGAIRIDVPMMQAAAATSGPILFAYALDSTLKPSLALLDRELEQAGTPRPVHTLPLIQFWPLFEAGETDAFAATTAAAIREALTDLPEAGCVVLAQASMAGAAPLLADLPCPVLASPELALRAALAKK